MPNKKFILGISGASGAIYGIKLLEILRRVSEVHLIVSPWAQKTIAVETDYRVEDVLNLAQATYDAADLTALPASGSFQHDGMVIAPCSIKTLSAIACGLADNLLTRAADVTIKERRPLLLMVRETPLSAIHLENMLKLARLGVIIMPPVPAFYHRPQTIDDIIYATLGRVLDLLGITNDLAPRWGH